MLSTLLSLIPGGGLTVAAAAAIAAVTAIGVAYRKGYTAGVNSQKVKEAKSRDENLKRIADAAGAVPGNSVHDDPDNRDNWKG